jgi:hypothetical protein
MTRREIERVASAVHDLEVEARKESLTPARVSLVIGRAVLGLGAKEEVWRKWLRATGWPESLIADMAKREAERGFRASAGLSERADP